MQTYSILQIPILEILDPLKKKFSSREFEGKTNYEDLMRFLQQAKAAQQQQQREDQRMEEQQQQYRSTRGGGGHRREEEESYEDNKSRHR